MPYVFHEKGIARRKFLERRPKGVAARGGFPFRHRNMKQVMLAESVALWLQKSRAHLSANLSATSSLAPCEIALQGDGVVAQS